MVPSVSEAKSAADNDSDLEPDPLFLDSVREAGWILVLWASCFIWTMYSCLSNGYTKDVDPETFPMVFGMPAWVAWGIALPWLIANAVTIFLCLGYMKDGDLGIEMANDLNDGSSDRTAGSIGEGQKND